MGRAAWKGAKFALVLCCLDACDGRWPRSLVVYGRSVGDGDNLGGALGGEAPTGENPGPTTGGALALGGASETGGQTSAGGTDRRAGGATGESGVGGTSSVGGTSDVGGALAGTGGSGDAPAAGGATNRSACAFGEIVVSPATPTSEAVCAEDPQINALEIPASWPELESLPGQVVLLTAEPSAHFRSFALPGLIPQADAEWNLYPTYGNEGVLRQASGSRLYYLDRTTVLEPSQTKRAPTVSLVDGKSLQSLWNSVPSWSGYHAGATVLADDTLIALTRIAEDSGWTAHLTRWTSEGALSTQPLDSITSNADNALLVGSDSSSNLYVLHSYPIELMILDALGNQLTAHDLSSVFAEMNRGAVTQSGAAYVGGQGISGLYKVVRVDPADGGITEIYQSASVDSLEMLAVWNENVVIGTCTDEPWARQVRGTSDALIVEYGAEGNELRSWQVGGDGADCVQAGAVGDAGQITVAVNTDLSTLHLVELLP